MKSAAERGQVGAWAYEARADADLSVEEVVERLTRIGQPVSAATIRGIEGGSKKPSRRLLRALGEVYGRRLPGESGEAGNSGVPGLSDLLARLEAQEQAITRLARAIELLVGETRDDFAGAVEAVAALEEQEAGTPSTRRSDDPPAAAEAPRTGSPGTGSSGPPRPGTPHPSAR